MSPSGSIQSLPSRASAEAAPLDAATLGAFRRREEGAVRAMYQRYGHLVYGVAHRVLERHQLAEEAVLDDPLVVVASALLGRTAVQRFPHALGPGEVLTSPRISMPDTSVSRQRRKQHYDQRCTQTQPALVSM